MVQLRHAPPIFTLRPTRKIQDVMSKDSKNTDIEVITSSSDNSFTKVLAREFTFYLSGEVLEP